MFDSVPHECLKVKLRERRVQDEVFAWIDDFLANSCQCVCANGQLSDWVCVRSGAPQGINDLPESVSGLFSM